MLKSYDEMRKIDVSPYTESRDGADYLNWAKCVDLLRKNGAETVYFVPIPNEKTGSSLIMCEEKFTNGVGKSEKTNRCYETRIEVHIDDKVYIMQSPVMNGANPVQDNSMSQQRIWNSMCRSFVKCVAINTGLGFDLWLKNEGDEAKNSMDDDLTKHDIFKIQERLQQLITRKMKEGLSEEKICENLKISREELQSYFTYFKIIDRLEKRIGEMKVDK